MVWTKQILSFNIDMLFKYVTDGKVLYFELKCFDKESLIICVINKC